MNESQTKKVERYHYKDFLSRAEQHLRAARHSFEIGDWDSVANNAVQTAISASDAYCTFKFSQHSSSQRHEDAIKLFRSIDPANEAHKANTNRLSRILSEKSVSAYGYQPVKRNEAEYLLTEAERLLSYIRSKLVE